jgi:hypothetical protein
VGVNPVTIRALPHEFANNVTLVQTILDHDIIALLNVMMEIAEYAV